MMDELLGFWTAVPNTVLHCSAISVVARLLYALLLSYARPSRGRMTVWPGVETLAKALGISGRTVKRALKELLDQKLIERKGRMGRSSLTFILHPPSIPSSGHQLPVEGDTSVPAEEDVVEEESPSGLSESSDVSPEPERTYDNEGSNGPPTESSRKQKEKHDGRREIRIGGGVMREWNWMVQGLPVPLPFVTNLTIPSKRAAAQTFAALKDTAFRNKSVKELMRLLSRRIQETGVNITFGLLFFERETRPRNLVALLSGDWARRKKPEPERDPREELLEEGK